MLDSQELEMQVEVSWLMWVLGAEPGFLEEQKVLFVTEPSLQLLVHIF